MIYEFKCPTCNTIKEVKCSISEHSHIKENTICECGEKMIQCVSQVPFGFIGSGWFSTGYASVKNNQIELESELRIYDKHRDRVEREDYDLVLE